MKKSARKLALSRDTILTLSAPPAHVAGGITVPLCAQSLACTIIISYACITNGCPTRQGDCTDYC